MKGYQSPAEHARQVALVKRSLSLSKRGGAPAPSARPEADMRHVAQLRVIGR
jgi:hypothetical protein